MGGLDLRDPSTLVDFALADRFICAMYEVDATGDRFEGGECFPVPSTR